MAQNATPLLAYLAFLATAITVAVNLWQFLRKRKQENSDLSDTARRALAERDSFVVKGAEGALLMMEKMLLTATTEAANMRERVVVLETEKRTMDGELSKQRQRIEHLEETEREVKRRLNQEREKTSELRRGYEKRIVELMQKHDEQLKEIHERIGGNGDGRGNVVGG